MLERGFDAVLRGYGRALKLCFRFHRRGVRGLSRHGGADGLRAQHDPQRVLPARGYRPAAGSTLAREDISFDAMNCIAGQGRRCLRQIALCRACRQLGRRRRRRLGGDECRPAVRGAEAEGERPPLQKVLADLRRQLGVIPGISTFMNPVQNLSSAPARRPANTSSSCRA